MKIIVKIGTQSVLAEKGLSLHGQMALRAAEIAQLKNKGHHVILVSSGAVGLGERMRRSMGIPVPVKPMRTLPETQLLAAEGQTPLMSLWSQFFMPHGLLPSQILLTHSNIESADRHAPVQELLTLSESQKHSIPILNENDAIAVAELPQASGRFTDNDHLARMVAQMICADRLLLLTGTDGLYDRNPTEPFARKYDALYADEPMPVLKGGSSLGRGGVESKITESFAAAQSGILTVVDNAHGQFVIPNAISENPRGTVVYPTRKMF